MVFSRTKSMSPQVLWLDCHGLAFPYTTGTTIHQTFQVPKMEESEHLYKLHVRLRENPPPK